IYFNYPEIDDSVIGNYANKVPDSFLFQVRRLNYELMVFASANPDFHICDVASVQSRIGRNAMFIPSIYVTTEMVLSVDAVPLVAARLLNIILTLKGRFKKCLILDL